MYTAPHEDPEIQECIDNAINCHAICLSTLTHCLSLGGHHATATHVTHLLDSALLSRTCAELMLRNSPRRHAIGAVCAEACERCAEDCERIGPGDLMMQSCASACRRCAACCKTMSHTGY